MRKANIAELKNHLSEFLVLVKKGETVRVFERNTPIAEITPIEKFLYNEEEVYLQQLETKGMISRGKGVLNRAVIDELKKNISCGSGPAGVLEQLLKDRREGR